MKSLAIGDARKIQKIMVVKEIICNVNTIVLIFQHKYYIYWDKKIKTIMLLKIQL